MAFNIPFYNCPVLFTASRKFVCLFVVIIMLLGKFVQAAELDKNYLDLSISIFDMNLPEDEQIQQELNIYSQVRSAEARYMPALLRATLLESNRWGAIRIIPTMDETAELMLSGKIIRSDGLSLELAILVTDGSGREWINKNYLANVKEGISLMDEGLNIDPFQELYVEILDDLLVFYEQLTADEVDHIKSLAQLRYASAITPNSFSRYLIKTQDGLFDYERLPAVNDPLLLRVQEIRRHEYIFIDVVDSQYQDFLHEIKPVYDLWREFQQELSRNSEDFLDRLDAERQFRQGSYRALSASYNNYRWQKMQSQYLDQLSAGFSNEVGSTELDLEDSIYRLSGTMAEQYQQWREILQSFYELEGAASL